MGIENYTKRVLDPIQSEFPEYRGEHCFERIQEAMMSDIRQLQLRLERIQTQHAKMKANQSAEHRLKRDLKQQKKKRR